MIKSGKKTVKSDKKEILALYRAQLGMPFCCWTEDYPSEEEIDFLFKNLE